jgi:hypothetical protein
MPAANEYAGNNTVISVAMQQRCKNAFPTIERLCFLCDPCKVVIKKSSFEKNRVKVRDASLPRYGAWEQRISEVAVAE